MIKAYCPDCNNKLDYCGGDVHKCQKCNKQFMTDNVLDRDGYYLLRRCPEHGVNTGGFYMVGETKHCITCDKHMLRLKPEVSSQREIFKQCDLLVERRNRWQVSADRMVRDTKAIRETLRLFKEYYQLSLTKEQEEELTKLRDFLDYLGFSYYWSAVECHKKFEDLWNANKPFVFS